MKSPPLPVVWISRPGLPAILDSSYNKQINLFILLYFMLSYILIYLSSLSSFFSGSIKCSHAIMSVARESETTE